MEYSFSLNDDFVEQYRHKKAPFGFNGLGETIYRRTYSRTINGHKEDWFETVRRVVEGTYSIQKNHIEQYHLGWNDEQGERSAEEMYDMIFNMKFLPPGRGLYCMGTPIIHQKNLAAALNNCAFVSTENIDVDLSKPFEFLMDATMLGVGVGFDTKGANKVTIVGPDPSLERVVYEIEDSREGWVKSVGDLILSYFGENGQRLPGITFDYSHIRTAGEDLKTYGGKSSGPKPLIDLHEQIVKLLTQDIGKKLSSTLIVDLFNYIGKCVIGVGNIRCAEIAFGEENDDAFLDLKNYEINPHRSSYGWTSNNSIFARLGMNYHQIASRICINGEPGLCWLENMRAYGRMADPKDYKDKRVKGGNPCLEQSLESYELCCLVETFPARHNSLQEYKRTLKFAYLYAKTVTLGMTHWPETNRVMLRNRRIGCSVSGVAQFLSEHSLEDLREWMDEGYNTVQHWDDVYSEWLCVPRSIKTTSIKPSGTVSLLAGATPGMHYPLGRFYIRRVRFPKDSDMLPALEHAGYHIEPAVGQENQLVVVEFPVCAGKNVRVIDEVSIFEQFSLAAFLQKYWADNQVSCTVTFDPKTESNMVEKCLDYFQYQLKGISCLPKCDLSCYPQIPYQEITEEQYIEMSKNLLPISWTEEEETLTTPSSPKAMSIAVESVLNNNEKKLNPFQIRSNKLKSSNSKKSFGSGIEEHKNNGTELNMYPSEISFCDSEKCMLDLQGTYKTD
ncbi:hypothetical protein WA158_003891 [Blastocystis sp. Blastoise]